MDEMDKEDMSDGIIIETNQTILTDDMFSSPQKLTPTGKISHAKTRVYTQRYRKEWELMPDFKGWLTAVQNQPTRAYCICCKKNLHAHRLSLLKHACTNKHHRAAEMAHIEVFRKSPEPEDSAKASELEILSDFEEVTVVGAIKSISNEDEDGEEYEYVVESLEVEEEEEEEEQEGEEETNDPKDMDSTHEEEIEDTSMKLISDEEPSPKKIKLEHYPRRDTLAEAMAHVHGDYLDHNDEHQGTVGLDMEVESETTILPDNEEHLSSADERNEKSRIKHHHQVAEDVSGAESPQKSKIVTYRLNSTNMANLQGANTVTISTNNNKTLTLNSGKTVTLNTAKIGGSTQYVLSKVKGNLPALVMAGSKSINHRPLAPKGTLKSTSTLRSIQVANSTSAASTSANVDQETHKQKETQKQNETMRIPCITTHVLDTSKGIPITGLQVSLYKLLDGRWTFLNESTTSGSGRCTDLVNTGKLPFTAGRYKMHFDVDKYFRQRKTETLYPFIEIVFDVKNPTGNYHIPVLLSPFGYTTYRGSDR